MDTCEAALHEVGSWLCYYDPRNRYELYGFGGILNGDNTGSSCFSLERVKSNKMFQGGPSAIEVSKNDFFTLSGKNERAENQEIPQIVISKMC